MRISDGSSDVCSSDLYANTRELAPIVASLGFAARIGCGFTSRIGAMRISEEIDALESMAIRPIPYLISTRVVASLIVMMPLFLIGLVGTYLATDFMVTTFFGQSSDRKSTRLNSSH